MGIPLEPSPDEIFRGPVLSWAEVTRTHRTRRGVYHRDGQLVSLLTDMGQFNSCYPDRAHSSGGAIDYTGEGRRGDQALTPGNRALLAAVETAHPVPLFCKLAAGRWRHTGLWRVASARHVFDEGARRMLWSFTLEREA